MNLPTWATILLALLGALGGFAGLASLLDSLTNARHHGVGYLETVIGRLEAEIGRLDKRIVNLETQAKRSSERISQLECEVDKWKNKYLSLCRWVESLGLEPFQDSNHN